MGKRRPGRAVRRQKRSESVSVVESENHRKKGGKAKRVRSAYIYLEREPFQRRNSQLKSLGKEGEKKGGGFSEHFLGKGT